MSHIITQDAFIYTLIDCMGYSREEATEDAESYKNDIGEWIADRGGNQAKLDECIEYIESTKNRR